MNEHFWASWVESVENDTLLQFPAMHRGMNKLSGLLCYYLLYDLLFLFTLVLHLFMWGLFRAHLFLKICSVGCQCSSWWGLISTLKVKPYVLIGLDTPTSLWIQEVRRHKKMRFEFGVWSCLVVSPAAGVDWIRSILMWEVMTCLFIIDRLLTARITCRMDGHDFSKSLNVFQKSSSCFLLEWTLTNCLSRYCFKHKIFLMLYCKSQRVRRGMSLDARQVV